MPLSTNEENVYMLLDKAITAILNGNGLLLAGSGASYGALNELGQQLPTGAGLAKILLEKCGNYPDTDLGEAAETYQEKFGVDSLISYLKALLNVTEIKDWHKTLYSQDWRNIYTTNYDRVPLIAARQTEKIILPLTLDSSPRKYADKDKCIYINGIIDNLNCKTINNQFKLTTSSYETSDHFDNSIWGRQFEDDVEAAEYIFIVGISLKYDLDLRRTYNFNEINKQKTIIITKPVNQNPNPQEYNKNEEEKRRLSRYGTVYPIGIEGFAKRIEEMAKTHIPITQSEWLYTCFEHYKPASQTETCPSPSVVYSFLVHGQFSPGLLAKKGHNYIDMVNRKYLPEILELVQQGKMIIYIHSDFGNGKTVLLQEIANEISRSNVPVYILKNENALQIQKDIDKICTEPGQKVVIIDVFNNYMDILHRFSRNNNNQITFILAGRTGLITSLQPEIDELFSCETGNSFIFDINKLNHAELKELSDIFVRNGLWREISGKPEKERIKYLAAKKNGNSEFQSILLDLLESSEIRIKVAEIVDDIRISSPQHFKALVIVLLARMLTLDITPGDLNRIIGVNIQNDAKFACNEGIRQILQQKKSNGSFVAKSSIVAKVILHRTSTINEIIDRLIDIANYCATYHELPRYYNILRNLVSFSLISTFISGFKDRHKFMAIYYERLSQMNYYSKNHFFWLQFAIALISKGDETMNKDCYLQARRYLENALGLKPDKSFIPFQINNQKARLLLKMIMKGFSDDVKDDFKTAHDLLKMPITSTRDNPAMVIKGYKYYLEDEMWEITRNAQMRETFIMYGREAYNNTIKLCNLLSGHAKEEAQKMANSLFTRFGAFNHS